MNSPLSSNFDYFYNKFLCSSLWKEMRIKFIESNYLLDKDRMNGDMCRLYKCDRCGWNFRMNELEVHHLHYLRPFGEERRQDILVLCESCHKIKDRIRAERGKQRSEEALSSAQYEGWLRAKYGDYADLNHYDCEAEYESFERFLERKSMEW